MNITHYTNIRAVRRIAYLMVAMLLFASSFSLFGNSRASADQLSTRSITLSDSGVSGGTILTGVGSGTNVTYQVQFTAIHQAGSMVINFCAEDPIINDTCTTPTGFSAASATLTNTGSVGQVGVAANNWTITPTAGTVKLADDGVSAHDIQAASTQTFQLNGITNPSTLGTFYARMYTYSGNAWGGVGGYTSPTVVGAFTDYGGIALSTANVITITARVQEQLTFCVTKADPATWTVTQDCSDPAVALSTNYPAITLGHGSPTPILDSSAVDTGNVWSQLSTNATHGAVINMRNSNLTCGGLSADGGATCAIPPINAGATGVSAMTAGTAAFGLFANTYTVAGMGTVGAVTPTANYYSAAHSTTPLWYGMDNTTAGNNVTSTYGSTVASTTSPVYRANDEYTFAATAALTTPAGIYTANMVMVATGTF